MARKGNYDRIVKPRLDEVRDWVTDFTEEQIALKLGISRKSMLNYKNQYPEFADALVEGRIKMVKDLKAALRKKAKGFYYTETKKVTKTDPDGNVTTTVEEYKKYAQPDTGAIHLLLKNNDPEWTNDDQTTIKIKREQLEIAKTKAEADSWAAEGG